MCGASPAFSRGEAAGRGDPARVAAHHFQDEHLGRGAGHRGDVEAGFADRHGDVLGDRAEARAAVGDRQVVVHGLRHVDGLHRVAQLLGQLRDLEAGVGRVAAAVVEEVADVVRLEDFDQALVLRAGCPRTSSACSAPSRTRRPACGAGRGWRRRFPCWCRSGLRSARRGCRCGRRRPCRCAPVCLRAVSMTPQAEALMTAVTPPDWA